MYDAVVDVAVLDELALHDPLDIAVQLGPARACRQWPDARKPRSQDLLGVVDQRRRGLALNRWPRAGQKFAQAHCRRSETTLGQRHRTHPQAHDAARPGVYRRFRRRSAPSEKKSPGGAVPIDASPDQVPDGRVPLPLVHQDWERPGVQSLGLGVHECSLCRLLEVQYGRRPTSCRGSLADALRPFDADGREPGDEVVELAVQNPVGVLVHTTGPYR